MLEADKLYGDNPEVFFADIVKYQNNMTMLAVMLYQLVYQALYLIPGEYYICHEDEVMDPRIRISLEVMNQNPAHLLTNEIICEYNKMNVNNFIRVFKREMGVAPKHYILMRRIEWSRNLLLNTDLSINEIADEAGFADRYHFSKSFRQMTGITPAAYRKTVKNKTTDI